MDNFYKNCPPKMNDARFLTNYKTSTSYNELIKYANNITRDDDYRLFLQTNANQIMDNEWVKLRNDDSCWNNACIHSYPLRMDPKDFVKERENFNKLFKDNELQGDVKCNSYADYRMSETPLQKYKVPKCGNGNC
jgi:hypothetical protein